MAFYGAEATNAQRGQGGRGGYLCKAVQMIAEHLAMRVGRRRKIVLDLSRDVFPDSRKIPMPAMHDVLQKRRMYSMRTTISSVKNALVLCCSFCKKNGCLDLKVLGSQP